LLTGRQKFDILAQMDCCQDFGGWLPLLVIGRWPLVEGGWLMVTGFQVSGCGPHVLPTKNKA